MISYTLQKQLNRFPSAETAFPDGEGRVGGRLLEQLLRKELYVRSITSIAESYCFV